MEGVRKKKYIDPTRQREKDRSILKPILLGTPALLLASALMAVGVKPPKAKGFFGLVSKSSARKAGSNTGKAARIIEDLSPKDIARYVKNLKTRGKGGKELHAKWLGSGSLQTSDLVLNPKYGLSVRKIALPGRTAVFRHQRQFNPGISQVGGKRVAQHLGSKGARDYFEFVPEKTVDAELYPKLKKIVQISEKSTNPVVRQKAKVLYNKLKAESRERLVGRRRGMNRDIINSGRDWEISDVHGSNATKSKILDYLVHRGGSGEYEAALGALLGGRRGKLPKSIEATYKKFLGDFNYQDNYRFADLPSERMLAWNSSGKRNIRRARKAVKEKRRIQGRFSRRKAYTGRYE